MARIAKTTTKKLTAKGAKQLEEARAKRIYVRKTKTPTELIAEEVEARRAHDANLLTQIQSVQASVASQGLMLNTLVEKVNGTDLDTIVGAMEDAKLIHEWVEGSHRILIVDAKGVRTGKWAARNEIAVLEEYRAAGSFFDGVFPAGVFKATEVQFAGLGG